MNSSEFTREQAVLAMIVAGAEDVIAKNKGNGFLGRTAMQKIPYFLQVCDVPVRYRFSVHHYGPFCSQILTDLESMELDNVVVDRSSKDHYSNYRLGGSAAELIQRFEPQLGKHRQTVDDVVEALYPWDPARLELFSTLHYAYRELRAMGQNPGFAEVIRRFEQYKDDKFESQDIEKMLRTMQEVGLVELVFD